MTFVHFEINISFYLWIVHDDVINNSNASAMEEIIFSRKTHYFSYKFLLRE